MSKHTPGPWEAQRDPNAIMADDWCIGAQGQIDMVAVCSERDASLIAAAPELLKALKECRNAIQGGTTVEPYDNRGAGFQQQFGVAFVEYLNAAIAKATGEDK